MRLEISAGGLTGSIAIADYQSNFSSFVTSVESMISSFKAVKSETHNLSGGVGNLQDALENIDARIRKEEEKKADAVTVQKKSNDFLELAVRVDRQVATLVNQNKEEFYRVNPWLRPAPPEREKAWYEKAWDTICDVGKAIGDGIGQAWNWVKDTAGKIWDGLVEFYKEYKQIIDTILVAVGAVVAVVAVIATGGVALVPLLGALGVSTTAAIAISTAVAVTAVVSTVAASAMNIVDIWCDIDNPVFNRIQKALNITSAITNTTYSIGNIYNSFKGVSGKEYIARQKAIENGELRYSNLGAEQPNMKQAESAVQKQEQLKKNIAAGKKAEEMRYNEILAEDPTAKQHISMRAFEDDGTLSKDRVILDNLSKSGGNEVKASDLAKLTENQRSVYPKLAKNGGVIVGEGKTPYVGGTTYGPGELNITVTRPSGTLPIDSDIQLHR